MADTNTMTESNTFERAASVSDMNEISAADMNKSRILMLHKILIGKTPIVVTIADKKKLAHMTSIANLVTDMVDSSDRAQTIEALVVGISTKQIEKMTIRKVFHGNKAKQEQLEDLFLNPVFDKKVVALKDVEVSFLWGIVRKSTSTPIGFDIVKLMASKSGKAFRFAFQFLSGCSPIG